MKSICIPGVSLASVSRSGVSFCIRRGVRDVMRRDLECLDEMKMLAVDCVAASVAGEGQLRVHVASPGNSSACPVASFGEIILKFFMRAQLRFLSLVHPLPTNPTVVFLTLPSPSFCIPRVLSAALYDFPHLH